MSHRDAFLAECRERADHAVRAGEHLRRAVRVLEAMPPDLIEAHLDPAKALGRLHDVMREHAPDFDPAEALREQRGPSEADVELVSILDRLWPRLVAGIPDEDELDDVEARLRQIRAHLAGQCWQCAGTGRVARHDDGSPCPRTYYRGRGACPRAHYLGAFGDGYPCPECHGTGGRT